MLEDKIFYISVPFERLVRGVEKTLRLAYDGSTIDAHLARASIIKQARKI